MNIKCIAYLAIVSNYINTTNGINSRIDKKPISRCNSAPDLRVLCNATTYASTYATATTYNSMNTIISCEQYKSNIYNKNKRNIYLRSKEKHFFDAKK